MTRIGLVFIASLFGILSAIPARAQTVPEKTAAAGAEAVQSSRPVLRVLIRPDYKAEETEDYISSRALPSLKTYGGGEVVIDWQKLLDADFMAGKAVELNDAMIIYETPERVYFRDAGYSMQKLTFRQDYFNLAEHANDKYKNTLTYSAWTANINLPDYGQLYTRYQLKVIDDANAESDRYLVRLLTPF